MIVSKVQMDNAQNAKFINESNLSLIWPDKQNLNYKD